MVKSQPRSVFVDTDTVALIHQTLKRHKNTTDSKQRRRSKFVSDNK
jgi:hypothetical protein